MHELLARIADRDAVRTEATLQADIRQLLLVAPLDLRDMDIEEIVLESPAGDRRRIDVEAGSTVIELKKDLRTGIVRLDAEKQLAGYVHAREKQIGRRVKKKRLSPLLRGFWGLDA